MFKTGDRVRVLASSFTKKTGPRTGSIGYVANVYESYYMPKEYCATPIDVLFTRYGFEKSKRNEHRIFVAVVPVVPPSPSPLSHTAEKDRVEEALRNKIIAVKSNRFKGITWDHTKARLAKNWENIPIGIIIPNGIIPDLTKCNGHEFIAWLNSILLNHDVVHTIMAILLPTSYMKGAIKDKFTAELLYKMASDKHFKRNFFETLKKDTGIRRELVKTLMQIITIGTMRIEKKANEEYTRWFIQFCKENNLDSYVPIHIENTIMSLLTRNLYCDYSFHWKKEMILSAGIDKLRVIVENMDIVRNFLNRLAPLGEDKALIGPKLYGAGKERWYVQRKVSNVRKGKRGVSL